ncbi:hypothetical protein NQ117_19335 [Paenibacillus sp. SC116]|uniref:hypothetical protein n=1 Tax=Paenibacillus sp. SC116 TaxID=2968986 RepID=UPI00215A876A|nr:hypothetical protein [Paenibacillus sp. SC116]MCR8845840.1 hypothetical protein [Paenibacillus sp. SC116]
MNCTEVMELMQLKLDDMEYDHNLLTEHMRRCPACAEMFDRLSRLHQQLVELPKVQPAYSLVDAILPQLDELDREKAPQAEENTIVAAPVPLIQSNSQEETLSRPKNMQGSTSPSVRMNKWFKWKAVSGVIAAGLVVGLFVINYQPVSQESADFRELSFNKSEEKVAKSTDPSSEQQSTEDGGKAVASGSTQTDPNHNGNGDNPGQHDARDAVDAEQESSGSSRKQPAAEEDTSKPLTTSKITPVKPQDSGSEQSSGKRSGNKGDEPKSNPETVKPASHQTPDTKPKGDKDKQQPPVGGQGITDGAGESTGRDKKGILPDEKEASLFTASIDSHSPDKSYTVRWINGQLMLYRYENNSPLIVQILDFSDAPEQIKWSEDNKQITVMVRAQGGDAKDYVYQVDNKGLHKVDAPAKPSDENAKSPAVPPTESDSEASTPESSSPVNGGTPATEPGGDPTVNPAPDAGAVSNP